MDEEVVTVKNNGVIFTWLSFLSLFILGLINFFLIAFPALFLLYPLLTCCGIVFGLLGVRLNLETHSVFAVISSIVSTLLNITMVIFMVTTLNFSFSAYGACRKMAVNKEGYGIWQYQNTTQENIFASVTFSDKTNDLSCQAIAIGPFWAVISYTKTLVGCVKSFGPPVVSCPKGYFGVSP